MHRQRFMRQRLDPTFGHGMHRHGWGHGGGRGGRGGGRSRRRGDVRAAILALLAERPMHGYEMIQELSDRSGGVWRPSPGSVYPTLQMLEDEGLIVIEETDGRKLASLTDAGRAEAERLAAEREQAPWEQVAGGADRTTLHRAGNAMGQLSWAYMQVLRAGTSEQKDAAIEILDTARRRLYALLAADEEH